MHHKMTLKQKLIIYFAGILLLALGIQAYFSYANSYRMMVEQVEASSNKSLKMWALQKSCTKSYLIIFLESS